MYNGSEKDKINIDDLVSTLLSERDPHEPPAAKPVVSDEEAFAEVEVVPAAIATAPQKQTYTPPKATLPVAEDLPVATDLVVITEEEEEVDAPAQAAPEEKIVVQEIPAQSEIPAAPLEDAPKKKRRGLFRKKEQEPESELDAWEDWDLKPIGHYRVDEEPVNLAVPVADGVESDEDISVDVPDQPAEDAPAFRDNDEFPEVKPPVETITMPVVLPSGVTLPGKDQATRVLPTGNDAAIQDAPVIEEPPADEQLPDQLSLEEMVRVEDIEPAEGEEQVQPQEDPEEQLRRNRLEKIRDFTLEGDEEEDNEPEDEAEEEAEEETPELEDFTGYQDTRSVLASLQYRCRTAVTTLLLSGILELVLLVLTAMTVLTGSSPIGPTGYLIVHLFALVLLIGLNYTTVGHGLSGLFMLRANNDSPVAVAAAVSLVDVLLHFAHPSDQLPYWAPLAGLLLLFGALGQFARATGIRRNFAFVSYPGEKYAATLIEEENALQEIGRRATGSGEATVAYFHRTEFLSDYLANAHEDDQGDDWSRWMTPVGIGLSVLLSVIVVMGGNIQDFWTWMTGFTGLVCMTMPLTRLAAQFPLNHCARVMLSRGGFMVGWKAVRQFGKLDALTVDIADLYPDESMLLHGIKTFSGAHVDDAILTAASLAVRSGGPLSMIFRRIIENREDLLSEVDSLVYEQGMGLSGWVDGRRVFVGNRRLLENHGIDVPSSDYEARYAKDGRRLVYLSMAGQLSAMFVVSYLPDPEIQEALQDLCRSRVSLLVRSCDPNITANDLCESFDLDEYYVDVLPAAAGRAYMQLVEQTSEHMPAVIASNGHILGMAWVMAACRSLRIKSRIALILQTILMVLGAFLFTVWSVSNTLSVFQPLLFLLVSFVLTCIFPLFKKV